ncbi:nucleolar complex-associated protein [Ancylostoma caninum]|uniref:Nucleolar complex protein 3 homolog n=1 Tax=Ancylostoma caninum TaxID=29170 RepID=A0A368HBX5_ANCCA|nr:nucleolar complex-associated protein [Ancylostoma caninum]
MGFASASREEKLKMMKTSHSRKTTRKLNRLAKKKKISRNIIDGLKDIKARKSKDSRKRAVNVEDDWVADREAQFDEEAEDNLPLDMLDADIDWENSAFAGAKRRYDQKLAGEANDDEEGDSDLEAKRRKFEGQLNDNVQEMLPIKLKDGTLLRPTREKEEESSDEEQEQEDEEEEAKPEMEDYSSLSASELLAKRKELIDQFKQTISSYAHHLLTNPQENIYKLRDLFHLCQGEKVHSLVRETVQKLALVSMLQVLIDIIPGYSIRELTAEEKQQKVKKETKKLQTYEESLLRYYLKFLQFCEKMTGKLNVKGRKLDESSFTHKMGMLCLKAMSRLVISAPHFNYATNILSTLIRLSLCKDQAVVSEVCTTLHQVFREDLHLRMSLFGARSIASLVTKRKGHVPPQLIATFLSLNIREVKNEDKKSGKGRIFAKRAMIKKERANKTARKYKKQLDKLEADLKELDAAETLSTKLKTATETMKHVFQCYFSVLKRVPNVALLEPVLEGLSKFAHLLGVEFFEDIVLTMEGLVDKEHLRLLDQLYCVNTVFVILSGEGQLLNVDPSRFYRSVYRLLNQLPFEKRPEVRRKQMVVVSKALDLMINERRKQLPLSRVAAFVKRLLSIATVMDDPSALCLVALVRSFFIAHTKLVQLVEEDDSEGGAGGVFRADIDDPDVSNALGSSVRAELKMLTRRRHRSLNLFAQNILHSVPSTGPHKLNPQLTSIKPWTLLERELEDTGGYSQVDMKYMEDIEKYLQKRQQTLTAKNLHFHISNWLESR